MNEEKSVIIIGTGNEAACTANMIRFDKKILCFVEVNSKDEYGSNIIVGGHSCCQVGRYTILL